METHRTAFKHGIAVEDIVYAVEHAIETVDLDPAKVLAIGPGRIGRGRGLGSPGCGSLITIS